MERTDRHDSVIYNIAGNAQVHFGDRYSLSGERHKSDHDQQLSCLRFPQMNARAEQISDAFPQTYDWILEPPSEHQLSWNHFATWLDSRDQDKQIYWIYGKPGSGKSTIMKYLDERILSLHDFGSWSNRQNIFKASFFFWSAGNSLQRSLEGLCRHLLVQILEQNPDLFPTILLDVQRLDLSYGRTSSNTKRLCSMLVDTIEALRRHSAVLLLVDGLDECTEDIDEQETLVELLRTLSYSKGTKIVISSRPENTLRDAFYHYPALCLENLTRSDIESYITSQLRSCFHWVNLEQVEPIAAEGLISDIIWRADGVFLWVALTVRGVIRNLRDGDCLDEIWVKLSQIPTNLNDYFTRILQSIEPQHRRESSVLLQLAVHEEEHFISTRPLSLIDTLFIREVHEDFVLDPGFRFEMVDFSRPNRMCRQLDSAMRKVNSRCKGLLQCIDDCGGAYRYQQYGTGRTTVVQQDHKLNIVSERSAREEISSVLDHDVRHVFVVPLHRSLLDFLLLPQQQRLLHSYTNGEPINARRYMASARIVQLLAYDRVKHYNELQYSLSSHVMSSLSIERTHSATIAKAALVAQCMERLAGMSNSRRSFEMAYYIDSSLSRWFDERSSFLTLTIDFQISSFVEQHMTAVSIKEKGGRPILDHILRPRFGGAFSKCFYTSVDVSLVRLALSRGAEPNELYDGASVWSRYLCYLAKVNDDFMSGCGRSIYPHSDTVIETLVALLDAGAATTIPIRWLLYLPFGKSRTKINLSAVDNFQHQWPDFTPRDLGTEAWDDDTCLPIADIVSYFAEFEWLKSSAMTELAYKLRTKAFEPVGGHKQS